MTRVLKVDIRYLSKPRRYIRPYRSRFPKTIRCISLGQRHNPLEYQYAHVNQSPATPRYLVPCPCQRSSTADVRTDPERLILHQIADSPLAIPPLIVDTKVDRPDTGPDDPRFISVRHREIVSKLIAREQARANGNKKQRAIDRVPVNIRQSQLSGSCLAREEWPAESRTQ